MNKIINKNSILITTSSFGKLDQEPLTLIESKGFHPILNPYKRKLTESEVDELINNHQPVGMIAGVEPLTRQVMANAKHLMVISRCGIGMDNVDLTAAKEMSIAVINTPDAPTIPVAELTIGMMLSLLRRIHRSDSSIRKGVWERPMGNLLHGKTVGLIGCGRIGSYVAELLSAFGCTILGCDPFLVEKTRFKLVDLDNLLSKSDIISIHMPYSKNNHHFINTTCLSKMKTGAFLVNAARGGLVDEKALMEVLSSGKLGGAAIDCFEKEPYDGPLKNLDNVLLTGHIGSYAREGRLMMEKQSVENLFRELERAGFLQEGIKE